MTETTLTLRLDADLKAEFAKAAKHNDRTSAQLLRDFMRDYLKEQARQADYDEWLKAQVQEALDDPRPNVAHEEVMAIMEAEIAALKKRA